MTQEQSTTSSTLDESADRARRNFLEKAGKLAAYTPPVMLALMYPGMHAVASGAKAKDKDKNKDKDKTIKFL